MGGDDSCDGIPSVQPGRQIDLRQFADGKVEGQVTPVIESFVTAGLPERVRVSEDGDADDGELEPVEDPVVVAEHPLGEGVVALGLHLCVDEDPFAAPVPASDFDEFVGADAAGLRFADDLLEFGVEEAERKGPIDFRGDCREGEGEELRKEPFEGLLPGTVVIDGFGVDATVYAGDRSEVTGEVGGSNQVEEQRLGSGFAPNLMFPGRLR
jgi:hypothetical protein